MRSKLHKYPKNQRKITIKSHQGDLIEQQGQNGKQCKEIDKYPSPKCQPTDIKFNQAKINRKLSPKTIQIEISIQNSKEQTTGLIDTCPFDMSKQMSTATLYQLQRTNNRCGCSNMRLITGTYKENNYNNTPERITNLSSLSL